MKHSFNSEKCFKWLFFILNQFEYISAHSENSMHFRIQVYRLYQYLQLYSYIMYIYIPSETVTIRFSYTYYVGSKDSIAKPDKVRYVKRNIFHVSMEYFRIFGRTGSRASNIRLFQTTLTEKKEKKNCCLLLF